MSTSEARSLIVVLTTQQPTKLDHGNAPRKRKEGALFKIRPARVFWVRTVLAVVAEKRPLDPCIVDVVDALDKYCRAIILVDDLTPFTPPPTIDRLAKSKVVCWKATNWCRPTVFLTQLYDERSSERTSRCNKAGR